MKSLTCSTDMYSMGLRKLRRIGRVGGRVHIALILDVMLGGNDAYNGWEDLRYCSMLLGCHCSTVEFM